MLELQVFPVMGKTRDSPNALHSAANTPLFGWEALQFFGKDALDK